MRQFFPQLPYELWQRILWYILRLTVEEKLEQCLPIKSNFDVYENIHHFENENWDGHSHTTMMDNAIVDHKILGYSHVFHTDCAMWFEGYDQEEILTTAQHEYYYRERAHMIFYRNHRFTLEKRRIDFPELSYKVHYLSQIYLDGTVQLVGVEHE